MKTASVLGAGGFIGSHLVRRLKNEGYYVKGVDLKRPQYQPSVADEYQILDLRSSVAPINALYLKKYNKVADEVYQLAADMGGAGYVFNKHNDASIMSNSALINLNLLNYLKDFKVNKIFFSSSACVYPEYNQLDNQHPTCSESSVYPALPDSEYGWEKLFSERLYQSFARNYNLNIRIARFHNIFGPYGAWNNGKEKAPAAICRKVALALSGGDVEIWGDGEQTRSFLYIDECLEGVRRLMESDYCEPINIGSEFMVSINELVDIVSKVAKKSVNKVHISGPLGVRGRNSDNKLIYQKLGWKPEGRLVDGIQQTYEWVLAQVERENLI